MALRLGLVGPGNRIKGLVTLSETQQEAFLAAQSALAQRERDGHLLQIFAANLREFEELLAGVVEALQHNRISHVELELIHREADRRVLNVLTAMRTFLDHWETNLKRRHGKASPEVARFLTCCSQQFDTRFGYRFAYKLRNFAQHCGLPVGKIALTSRSRVYLLDPQGGPTRRMTAPSRERDEAELLLKRKELLERFDAWGPVAVDLKRGRSDINLVAQLRSAARGLSKAHDAALATTTRAARKHALELRQLMDLVRDDDTRRVPTVMTIRKKPKGVVSVKLHHFLLAQMRMLLPRDAYLAALG